MYKNLKIALVIPAYNEEKLIRPTLKNVPGIIDKIYVIDDCSTDNMPRVIRYCITKDKRIAAIRHKKNMGVGQAIITGYKKAIADGYDVAVVIGGDFQMDLAEISNFLEPIYKKEADYVKGNRFMFKQNLNKGSAFQVMPFKRFFGNSVLSLMTKIASGYWDIFDTQDGYTAISKEAIKKVNWNMAHKGYGYVSDWLVLFNIFNLRVKDVPRTAIYRKGVRQSQIKIGRYIFKMTPRLIWRFFWRLKMKYFYYNFHPLIFFYGAGFVLLPLGLIVSIKLIYDSFIGPVSGNQAILAALLILTGTQFLMFAIMFDFMNNSELK